jgi:hypothetical protein
VGRVYTYVHCSGKSNEVLLIAQIYYTFGGSELFWKPIEAVRVQYEDIYVRHIVLYW